MDTNVSVVTAMADMDLVMHAQRSAVGITPREIRITVVEHMLILFLLQDYVSI